MAELKGMTEHRDDRLPGLPIHYVSNHRPDPDSLVILMPSALANSREDRSQRRYARWSWQTSWPTSLVLAFSDPAMQQSPELNGAWYIHPEHDVVAAISATVADIARDAGIPPERIVFYGSSLGGFGSIGCAAELPGSRAVAEVPQIDFRRWVQSASTAVEQHILHGPMAPFAKAHPERISVVGRLLYANLVPPISLISNAGDRTIGGHRRFIAWCQRIDLPRIGEQTLEVTDLIDGHGALKKDDAVSRVSP